jgi:hypothetical protein
MSSEWVADDCEMEEGLGARVLMAKDAACEVCRCVKIGVAGGH